jgi:flagellin FlaB
MEMIGFFFPVFHNAKIVPFSYFLSGIEGNLYTRFKISQSGAIGIGAMIVFIAMLLVAGMATYVLLSTSSQLQIKSSTTGGQTIKEVSTGLKISTIEGHNTSGEIDKIVIIITPRPGSPDVDLDKTLIEISDPSVKCVLNYSSSYWVDGKSGVENLFTTNAYSSVPEFGVIVLKDEDSSCTKNTPVLTRGDNVMLTLNTTAIFGGIAGNINILGNIMPEEGAWGIINFRTPSAFANPVVMLQED